MSYVMSKEDKKGIWGAILDESSGGRLTVFVGSHDVYADSTEQFAKHLGLVHESNPWVWTHVDQEIAIYHPVALADIYQYEVRGALWNSLVQGDSDLRTLYVLDAVTVYLTAVTEHCIVLSLDSDYGIEEVRDTEGGYGINLLDMKE